MVQRIPVNGDICPPAYLVGRNPGYSLEPELQMQLVCLFTLLAVSVCVSAIIFHTLFLSAKAVAKFADGKMPAWMRTIICRDDAGGGDVKLSSLPADEKKFYLYSRAALRLFLFFYVFMNTCALFGMILAILAKRPALIFPFVGLSALLMLFYFPNLRKLIENAKTIKEYQVD